MRVPCQLRLAALAPRLGVAGADRRPASALLTTYRSSASPPPRVRVLPGIGCVSLHLPEWGTAGPGQRSRRRTRAGAGGIPSRAHGTATVEIVLGDGFGEGARFGQGSGVVSELAS